MPGRLDRRMAFLYHVGCITGHAENRGRPPRDPNPVASHPPCLLLGDFMDALLDEFVLAHFLGWFGKALIIRWGWGFSQEEG